MGNRFSVPYFELRNVLFLSLRGCLVVLLSYQSAFHMQSLQEEPGLETILP